MCVYVRGWDVYRMGWDVSPNEVNYQTWVCLTMSECDALFTHSWRWVSWDRGGGDGGCALAVC